MSIAVVSVCDRQSIGFVLGRTVFHGMAVLVIFGPQSLLLTMLARNDGATI